MVTRQGSRCHGVGNGDFQRMKIIEFKSAGEIVR